MNKTAILLSAAIGLAACEGQMGGEVSDKTVDRGFDAKDLSELKPGIWIDPNGCHHWIIDDGLEGYLSQRFNPDGTPVCTGDVGGAEAIGSFKDGSIFPDIF